MSFVDKKMIFCACRNLCSVYQIGICLEKVVSLIKKISKSVISFGHTQFPMIKERPSNLPQRTEHVLLQKWSLKRYNQTISE